MLAALPIRLASLTIRQWTRKDVDLLGVWPCYPFPYEAFGFSFAKMDSNKRDELFRQRQGQANMIVLVADDAKQPAMGYIALKSMDWGEGIVGNFGFRIHPERCDQGIGTSVLQEVTRWSFDCGMNLWRVDVAASNGRAIRCYEKVGFVRTGEIWRDASDLDGIDTNEPRYAFVRPHIRRDESGTKLRFWLMELVR